MDTKAIETTTVHDYKPTHPARPDVLEEARENMLAAWEDHDFITEAYVNETVTLAEMEASLDRALAAEIEYNRVYTIYYCAELREAAHVMTEEGLP